MYSFFVLPRSWPAFTINSFRLIPAKVVLYFQTLFCSFILVTIVSPDWYFMFILMQFQRLFRLTEVDCFAFTTVNFISNFVFIFCTYSIFWFTIVYAKCFKCKQRFLFSKIWVCAVMSHQYPQRMDNFCSFWSHPIGYMWHLGYLWISWTHPFDNFSDKDRVISKATRNFHNCLVSSGIIYVDCNTENVFYLLVINTTCSILEKLFKSLSLDLTDG